MDSFEFYPDRKRLVTGALLGTALGVLSHRIWPGALDIGGVDGLFTVFLATMFLGIGLLLAIKSLIALVRPRPCFVGNAEGFSVMGQETRRWAELQGLQIRSITVGPIATTSWISLRVRKPDDGPIKRLDIPWTHLPAAPKETAAAIEQLARLAAAARAPAARAA